MTKSVCIATYNGSRYIVRQLDSVMQQLGLYDEIIIVDDCSQDNTIELIKSFKDERICIYRNAHNLGHVKSFERAISLAKKELIFLSDQDDIWEKRRLRVFEEKFMEVTDVQLITSNFFCIDDKDRPIDHNLHKVSAATSFNYKNNIIGIFKGNIGYYGCAMAFRKELLPVILPIPEYVEAHDLWIAMAANILRSNLHIDAKTLRHRIHDSNASNLNRNVLRKIEARLGFIKQYRELSRRHKLVSHGTRC